MSRLSVEILRKIHMIFMPPTLKKWGTYWFRFVRGCVWGGGGGVGTGGGRGRGVRMVVNEELKFLYKLKKMFFFFWGGGGGRVREVGWGVRMDENEGLKFL